MQVQNRVQEILLGRGKVPVDLIMKNLEKQSIERCHIYLKERSVSPKFIRAKYYHSHEQQEAHSRFQNYAVKIIWRCNGKNLKHICTEFRRSFGPLDLFYNINSAHVHSQKCGHMLLLFYINVLICMHTSFNNL